MSLDAFSDPVWDAIRAHLAANWTATPLAYPNEFYDPIESDAWVYVEIMRTLYAQESIGASTQAENRWDEEGMLWFHLNATKGVASTKIAGASKALADLFRGLTLLSGGLEFMDANIDAGGINPENGNWFMQSINLAWRHWNA